MSIDPGHPTVIWSTRVLGATVVDPSGHKLGEIRDIVLAKNSDHVLFVIVGFGGVLGLGEKFHPVPWHALRYEKRHKAYVVDHTHAALSAAPAGSIEELTRDGGVAFRDRAFEFYKAPANWPEARASRR
jgi:sporulation protein YlmC with PRC-barrel domain